MLKSRWLFALAAVTEIGEAYFIWQWQRAGKAALLGLLGAAVLFGYGVIQSTH